MSLECFLLFKQAAFELFQVGSNVLPLHNALVDNFQLFSKDCNKFLDALASLVPVLSLTPSVTFFGIASYEILKL